MSQILRRTFPNGHLNAAEHVNAIIYAFRGTLPSKQTRDTRITRNAEHSVLLFVSHFIQNFKIWDNFCMETASHEMQQWLIRVSLVFWQTCHARVQAQRRQA